MQFQIRSFYEVKDIKFFFNSTLKEKEGAKGEEGKEGLVRLGVYELLFELFTLDGEKELPQIYFTLQ